MTKEVTVKQVSGITFVAKGNSNHWVVMDGSTDFGGSLAGSAPKELLLMSLGGCTSSDVVSILKKRRVPVQNFELNVKGVEREEHPRIFTSIHIEYVFYGDGIEKADVERAIELSTTKYCSVSAILEASVPITHSYRIEPAVAVSPSTVPVN
ncbi:MAG TPA: osmotically inducible protein OsmC [Bacteroidetes bacterium]|nr:osmotically inducible protein OsmC [Bacteroidota bacterium]